MGNGEKSGSGGRIDWRIRFAGAVGGAVVGGLALLVLSLADLHLFPLGTILWVVAVGLGIFLGQFVGGRLFRPSSGGPPDPPPPA
jgi:hypothetical protein